MWNLLLFRALKPKSMAVSPFICTSKLPLSSSSAYGAVADLAADDDDDNLDLVRKPPVTVTKPVVLPNVLQPRVVVFDGVCRLCHSGTGDTLLSRFATFHIL